MRMWEELYLVCYGSYSISCLKSEIADPKSKMASIGTLLMATNEVELVCHTAATVITSVWPNNQDAWWPMLAFFKFP